MAKNPGYCTGFRQGGAQTQSCCQKHDEHYAPHSGVRRDLADLLLRECLTNAGYPARAWVFWVAVRLVGWAPYYWKRLRARFSRGD